MERGEYRLPGGDAVCLLVMEADEFDGFCTALERLALRTAAARRWWRGQVRRVRQSGSLLLLVRNAHTAPVFERYAVGVDWLTVYATEIEPGIYPFPASPDRLQG